MIVVDPSKPRGIVWLASYPRSGNTWTRIFLARLIQVLSGQAVDEVEFAKGMKFAVGDSQVALYQGWLQRPAFQNSPADVAKARLPALKSIVEHSPGIVPMKTHNANVALFDVRLMSPEISAGAVYIVRNPLDVAISLAHFNSDSIDDAIAMMGTSGYATPPSEEYLFELRGSWSEHVHTWTAVHDDSLLVVRYEDMLAEPMEAFGAIAKHTMMNCTAAQLEQAVALSSFQVMSDLEAKEGFAERPGKIDRFFRKGETGQWRTVLTEEQVAQVITDHGAEMKRMGYLD